MLKKNTNYKGSINKYWIKYTLKYYLLMLVVFYFVLNIDTYQLPENGFFLFPNDFLGFGISYGGFFELHIMEFIIYNCLSFLMVMGAFITFFMILEIDSSYSSRFVLRALEFPRNKSIKNVKWNVIYIMYIYLVPILSVNTILIFK
jgi:hypothetical protein